LFDVSPPTAVVLLKIGLAPHFINHRSHGRMFRKQEIVDLFVSKDENSYLIYNPFAINVPKLYIIEINEDKFHYNNWIIVYGFEYKAVL
jgi:hypothetical protein